MSRLYIVTFEDVAVSAIIDFFETECSSRTVLKLKECKITQNTEAGDSESEQLRFQILRGRGNWTNGSGGNSAVTPKKRSTGDATHLCTYDTLHTTVAVAGTGTLEVLEESDENIHNGFLHAPPDDDLWEFSPDDGSGNAEGCIIRLAAAPADPINFSGYAKFLEIGG